MRYFAVARYDPADDPGQDGWWRIFAARVREDRLGSILEQLYRRAYGSPSIDVTDLATGEPLPENEWPVL